MKPEGRFVAERIAAQHSNELLRGNRQAANPLKDLAQFGSKLPELLERELGGLCAGAKTVVQVREPVEWQAGAVGDRRGDAVLSSTFSIGPRDAMAIASVPGRAVLTLVDVALGGSGKKCAMPAGKLPLSAQLMFGRLEKVLVSVLAKALGYRVEDGIQLKGSSTGLEASTPFEGCKRTVLPLEITVGEGEPWELSLIFPGSAAATLLAGTSRNEAAKPAGGKSGLAPLADPLGAVPLPMKAVLVDMPIAVSALSRLKPGMVIPVSVARNVPLMVGDQVIAHGSVGAMDDRAALQLTRISSIKEK